MTVTGKYKFLITAEDAQDAPIPNLAGADTSSLSFGMLTMAQALGDRHALQNAGRKVLRFHLEEGFLGGLIRLTNSL